MRSQDCLHVLAVYPKDVDHQGDDTGTNKTTTRKRLQSEVDRRRWPQIREDLPRHHLFTHMLNLTL
jgi:hypothetical protein